MKLTCRMKGRMPQNLLRRNARKKKVYGGNRRIGDNPLVSAERRRISVHMPWELLLRFRVRDRTAGYA